jgi:hypothetical protein
MAPRISLIVLVLLCAPAHGQKTIQLHRTRAPISIDGRIDEAWAAADSSDDFFQQEPYYAQPPTHRTVVRLLTSDEALYCLVLCYDHPADIQQYPSLHDALEGDAVSLMLDTFGDRKTAYTFAVSAAGASADCRLLDDARNRDYSWDGVWFAGAMVHPWGYAVEMQIPYRTIKYDPALDAWGLDVNRWVSDTKENLYWCTYEQNEGQRVSRFGRVRFEEFRPTARALNLEVYPVGIARSTYDGAGSYDTDPDLGLDVFYNPSPALTFLLTANPDFAQIEADPFSFNISRYESYFEERRPFFTEGNELFMASGRQSNTGFYRPLELFYSRRIGKALPDGSLVPLLVGSKAFGRVDVWEYGGFIALTGEREYVEEDERQLEPRATFGCLRLSRQVFQNSTVGLLAVTKSTREGTSGVVDIDGALRTSDWQLSYQAARSFSPEGGDFAGSAGFLMFGKQWINYARMRAVGTGFEVSQVGFVPWRGTLEVVGLSGPIWYMAEGYIKQILLYGILLAGYEHEDLYTDRGVGLGFNMQFRDNWGYEINTTVGPSLDAGVEYTAYDLSFSTWFNTSPAWNGNVWGGHARSYNFSREYLGTYSWTGVWFNWNMLRVFQIGGSAEMNVERRTDGAIEDITYNARPFFSLTPMNNLNIRLYVDAIWLGSGKGAERVLGGLLFSYNFLPKSWIYLAINEIRERPGEPSSAQTSSGLALSDRVGVFKVKYLYYF